MSNVVLVTEQCYLIAKKIDYIAIDYSGQDDYHDDTPKMVKKKRGRRGEPTKQYTAALENIRIYKIMIRFEPENSPNQGRIEDMEIRVKGKDQAQKLFKEMLEQIREQLPDKLYVDQLVNKFFTSSESTNT